MTLILPDTPKTPYPDFAMRCDQVMGMVRTCKNPPMRAPRIIVPSMTPEAPDHTHLRMMTTLHFCELHRIGWKAADFLDSAIKARFEATAKTARPIDFKCNFHRAWIDWVLTTTPEYRSFMNTLGYHGIRALAIP
jgi:hypothetical protein